MGVLTVETITQRYQDLANGLNIKLSTLIHKVDADLRHKKRKIDDEWTVTWDKAMIEKSMALCGHHPDYSLFAGRIEMRNIRESCPRSFSQCTYNLATYNQTKGDTGSDKNMGKNQLLDPDYVAFVQDNAAMLDACINHDADWKHDIFAMRTFQGGYLLRLGGKISENPQFMLMRSAVDMHRRVQWTTWMRTCVVLQLISFLALAWTWIQTLMTQVSTTTFMMGFGTWTCVFAHTIEYDGGNVDRAWRQFSAHHGVWLLLFTSFTCWHDALAIRILLDVILGSYNLLTLQKERYTRLEHIKRTYGLLSRGKYTQASPTFYNSGMPNGQKSSCFLQVMDGDSLKGIYSTRNKYVMASKGGGGGAIATHCIRATGAPILGTNGVSNGLVPMLRTFEADAKYVDQGGGKRKGALAIYLEPWHCDIEEVLKMRRNNGCSLFFAIWYPDLFFERCEADGMWTLFSPDEAPGLEKLSGEEFKRLYEQYESDGRGRTSIKAQKFHQVLAALCLETGTYALAKDAANRKSNQQNLGTIQCSNLCTEIIQFASKEETAVCNLASISTCAFVKPLPECFKETQVNEMTTRNTHVNEITKAMFQAIQEHAKLPNAAQDDFLTRNGYDHADQYETTYQSCVNANAIMDSTGNPTPEAETSNRRHRAIGLGLNGLADTFAELYLPYDSPIARVHNKEITETLYFAALRASCDLAKIYGPYSTFKGSPASRGILQFHMWGVEPSERWPWQALIADIQRYGLRNSLTTALMPTASTAQLLGNNECFEPYALMYYVRRTKAGEHRVICKSLIKLLIELKLWNGRVRHELVQHRGTIQPIKGIPDWVKAIYRTWYEIGMLSLIQMSADRAPFIDHSQSLNLPVRKNTTTNQICLAQFTAWKLGLKTLHYYLRSEMATDPMLVVSKNLEGGCSGGACSI